MRHHNNGKTKFGLLRAKVILMIFTLLGLIISCCDAAGGTLPTDFQDEKVKFFPSPSDFAFTPDGRLLLITKKGDVYVMPDPDNSDEMITALDMSDRLCDNGGRGLGTVAVHPDFMENKKIYLFWTFKKHGNCELDGDVGPVDRVSQFILKDNNKIDWESEVVILNTPELSGFRHHYGCMEFDQHGYMWITHGDGHLKEKSNDDSHLFSKLMRLTPDGDIPEDNPFAKTGDRCSTNGSTKSGNKCAEIYASGLRNPFRCAIDPNIDANDDTVRIYINDVGEAHWEEISECNTNEGCSGSHFGWYTREGPCEKGVTEGNLCKPDSRYKDPFHYYEHDGNDSAVTGGAFLPNDIGWPSKYNGCYFYGEYVWGKMFCLKRDESKECRNCDTPVPGTEVIEFATDLKYVVTMKFAPYKDGVALYYLTRGDNEIRRITYIGSGGNQNPIASINADETSGLAGLTISFDGSDSTDPDGNDKKLQYEWDLDGDGVVDALEVNPSYTYEQPGVYVVTLTVIDENDGVDTATIEIRIGTPPEPEIIVPAMGTTFNVGDRITLTGRAYDVNPLNPNLRMWLDDSDDTTNLCWEVLQHHNTHTHPWLEYTCGNNIPIDPAPIPEDFYAATNSYLGITLTAINNDGLKKAVSRVVMPNAVQVLFQSDPPDSGLFIKIDGTNVQIDDANGINITAWVNHQLPIEAFDQCSDKTGVCYTFNSWSDNGPSLHTVDIQTNGNNPAYTAKFDVINDSETDEPTGEPTDKPTNRPTTEPTDSPTTEPTVSPTEEPTSKPTKKPATEKPTALPTSEPTVEPTVQPTVEATESPTAQPTVGATETPTDKPSSATNTVKPTFAPTNIPSDATEQPTTNMPTTTQPSINPDNLVTDTVIGLTMTLVGLSQSQTIEFSKAASQGIGGGARRRRRVQQGNDILSPKDIEIFETATANWTVMYYDMNGIVKDVTSSVYVVGQEPTIMNDGVVLTYAQYISYRPYVDNTQVVSSRDMVSAPLASEDLLDEYVVFLQEEGYNEGSDVYEDVSSANFDGSPVTSTFAPTGSPSSNGDAAISSPTTGTSSNEETDDNASNTPAPSVSAGRKLSSGVVTVCMATLLSVSILFAVNL